MRTENDKTEAVSIAVEIDRIKMEMIALQSGYDPEIEHGEADNLLCELLILLGHQDVVDEYEKVTKWFA
ncbi:MAG: hypothetical protein [Caudoviricetes sp.]|nr:MAG: hypothetical protein [Caudoviricetes sp.]